MATDTLKIALNRTDLTTTLPDTMAKRKMEPEVKVDDYMDNDPTRVHGVKSLVTWFIHSGKTQLHIATANIREAPFDIIIIPVDANLQGPGIGLYDIKQTYQDIMPYKRKHVVDGDVVLNGQSHGFSCKEVALAVVMDKTSADTNWSTVVRDVLTEVATRKFCTIGIMIKDSYDVAKFVRTLTAQRNVGQEDKVCVFLCSQYKTTDLTTMVRDIDQFSQTLKLPRRSVSTEMLDLFPRLKIRTKIHRGSLLDTGCQSVVAAVGQDLNLKQGGITKHIADAAGEVTQDYIQNQKDAVEYWKVIRCPSGKLNEESIYWLLLGCVPKWEKLGDNVRISKLLAKFIFGCLLMADESGCSSIAIPLIGTGRLNYPERTVFASILDGIELYAQLATLQKITEVVIAFPNIDTDCYPMYVSELQRRENKETKLLFKKTNGQFLSSTNTPTKYSIVKGEDLQNQLPIEFVEVELNNSPGKSFDTNYQMDNARLRVNCEINGQNFKDVVRSVAERLLTEKITYIVVYTSRLPTISAVTQVDGIIDVFESYKHKHIYLYRVLVVVSNEDEFTSCNVTVKKRSKHNVESITTLNTVNVGPIWQTKEVCFSKLDDNTYIVNANPSDIESVDKSAHNQESALDMDIVTAEINPGVTQYLWTNLKIEYWKQTIKSAFNLSMFEANGTMMLEGTFDNICKVEAYLETDFPNYPTIRVDQPISDQHRPSPYSNGEIVEVNKDALQKKPMIQASYIQLEKESVEPLIKSIRQDHPCTVTRNTNDGATSTENSQVVVGPFICPTNDMADEVSTKPVQKKSTKETPHKQLEKALEDPLRNDTEQNPSGTVTRNGNVAATAMGTPKHSLLVNKKNSEKQISKPKDPIDKQSRRNTHHDTGSVYTGKGKPYIINKMCVYVYQTDITTVPTDTLVCTDDPSFKHTKGLSRYILSRAGKYCVDEWLQLASQEKLEQCRCIITLPGDLNYLNIIHVIRPQERNTVHKAFYNILDQCTKSNVSSVAIPTIGAGFWDQHIHDCAEQYYNALQAFSGSSTPMTSLSEIHIVDKQKTTIDTVRSVFDKRLSAVPKHPMCAPTDYIPFSVFSSTVAVTKQSMFSFRTDVKVLTTNGSFSDDAGYVKEALTRCPIFKSWFNYRKGRVHECSEIRWIQGSDRLFCQDIIVVVRPWSPKRSDQGSMKYFKSDVQKAVKNIMDNVLQLGKSTVAIPMITNSENREVKDACCDAMAKEIVSFAQSSSDLTVHVVTGDANYDRFCSMLKKLLHGGSQYTRESSV